MKNKKISENYLLRLPERAEYVAWSKDEESIVTLEIENKGIFNRLAQRFLKKPKISYIHLDKFGSFVWVQIDGKRNIVEIGDLVYKEFGEEAQPLYERLAKYFQILESYNFIKWHN